MMLTKPSPDGKSRKKRVLIVKRQPDAAPQKDREMPVFEVGVRRKADLDKGVVKNAARGVKKEETVKSSSWNPFKICEDVTQALPCASN